MYLYKLKLKLIKNPSESSVSLKSCLHLLCINAAEQCVWKDKKKEIA